MKSIYKAKYCTLHVRQSNKAAIALYKDTLGFSVHKVEKGYCESSDPFLVCGHLLAAINVVCRCGWGGRV
jgi:peptide alpha-N-acetyltransferase